MNAVIGILVDGCDNTGALCARHSAAVREAAKKSGDAIQLFTIKRYSRPCSLCRELRKRALTLIEGAT